MGKIVIYRDAIRFTTQLQTATSINKRTQRVSGICRRYTNMASRCNRHQAIVHIMFAYQRPFHFAHFFAIQQDFPFRSVSGQLFRLPVTLLTHQLLLAPAAHRHGLFQVDVIFRPDNTALPRNDTHQMVELFLDRFQVVKDIGVIELKVVEDQRTRAVMDKFRAFVEEGAVILIRFDNKEVAFAQTRRNLKVPRHTADHKSRFVTALFQNPGRHSRGGSFAVCTGNGQHPAVAQHKIVQPLWT